MKRAGSKFRKACAAALLLAALGAAPAPAPAQCPLCRSSLERGDDRTASTMNLAILVLLIPPVSIFCVIFAVAYRWRDNDEDENRER